MSVAELSIYEENVAPENVYVKKNINLHNRDKIKMAYCLNILTIMMDKRCNRSNWRKRILLKGSHYHQDIHTPRSPPSPSQCCYHHYPEHYTTTIMSPQWPLLLLFSPPSPPPPRLQTVSFTSPARRGFKHDLRKRLTDRGDLPGLVRSGGGSILARQTLQPPAPWPPTHIYLTLPIQWTSLSSLHTPNHPTHPCLPYMPRHTNSLSSFLFCTSFPTHLLYLISMAFVFLLYIRPSFSNIFFIHSLPIHLTHGCFSSFCQSSPYVLPLFVVLSLFFIMFRVTYALTFYITAYYSFPYFVFIFFLLLTFTVVPLYRD